MLTITNYQITQQIYESANSLVYRALRDNQPIILKVLKENYPSPEELTRYRQEYDIVCHLADLDGVVKAYSLEKHRKTLVICLEDFGAESLKIWLDEQRTFTFDELLTFAIRATEILGQIHGQNIIHKDINPSNIILNPSSGVLKIIDFGISTQFSKQHLTLKNPDMLEGTLAYMSPEQTGRMNRALDYRSDFYSLGATFYELFTGKVPFESKDAMELVHCHIAKQPKPPSQINPDLPPAISNIILKLLEKTAEARYQSAWGIKADLEQLQENLPGFKNLAGLDFEIAQKDISARFQIPQKLYGRESEIDTLLSAFERVANGKTEILLIAGYSGIGKSVLVKEIYKSLTGRYFISGKFDQYQRNIPYSALAFKELVRQLLTESETQLRQWKDRILTALGPNGQVIIDVLPEMELIIGKQPKVPQLGATESQNRFNLVFQNFMRVFCQPKRPLVMFLDDLQWVDSATLNLLELVTTDKENTALFLIGADNEVDPTHPLITTLDKLREENVTINQITLKPLAFEHINQLIAESLHQDSGQPQGIAPTNRNVDSGQPQGIAPTNRNVGAILYGCPQNLKAVGSLTDLVMRKTGGNPFFVNQFLHTLYEKKLLKYAAPFNYLEKIVNSFRGKSCFGNFASRISRNPKSTLNCKLLLKGAKYADSSLGKWQWDIDKIETLNITDNIVELMIGKLKKLPKSAQRVLRLAACVGNRFDLNTLSVIYEKSATDTFQDLMPILTEGLILPLSELEMTGNDFRHSALIISHFKFLHDRVQQAAYVDDEQKQAVHLQIGRFLLKNTPKHADHIFDIVEQLNQGIELVYNQAERNEIARLNLIAGQKAKMAIAYIVAQQYLNVGIELLPVNSWISDYQLTLALHKEMGEVTYLNGHFEQSETLLYLTIDKANSANEKANIYNLLMVQYTLLAKYQTAIETGRKALSLLGVNLPDSNYQEILQQEIAEINQQLGNRAIASLINEPWSHLRRL
ncbi:MAG: serine/threonine-protein kinase PknK [Pseudomonadota bacterium]